MVVLSAKFGPSRVVRPSGVFPGSSPPVLWLLLTSVFPRRLSRTGVPGVAAGPETQISLSKNVNFPCATAPFISGTKHGTLLRWASLSVPSTLYGVSVRRLIRFELGFLPTEPRGSAVALL